MKTKLTPELQEKIIKYIKGGNYIVIACQAVGISEVTYYDWIKRGKAGEEPFLKFLKSIKKAKAEAEIKYVSIVQNVANRSWQAAAWWLERTNWKRWGRKDKLEPKRNGLIKYMR